MFILNGRFSFAFGEGEEGRGRITDVEVFPCIGSQGRKKNPTPLNELPEVRFLNQKILYAKFKISEGGFRTLRIFDKL